MRRTSFAILCLEGATISFAFAAGTTLVPAIAEEFRTTGVLAGSNNWIYMLAYGGCALLYGPLVTLFDAKKINLFCLLCFCLSNLVAAFSANLAVFLAARFFMGIFAGAVIPITLILIGRYAKSSNRGKLVGSFFSATFIASLAGLFLSGFISWRMIFFIPAVFGLILWIHVRRYLEDFRTSTETFRISYRKALAHKGVVSIFIYIFFVSMLYYGIQQWWGLYFWQKYGFGQFVISMLVTLISLSGIIGEFTGGFLSDSLGRIKTINSGVSLMILALVLLLLPVPKVLVAAVMVIWGIGWTFNHSGLSTLLTDAPAEFLNESASLNSSVRFLAGGAGALIGGALMARSAMVNLIILSAGLFVLALCSGTLLKNTAGLFASFSGGHQGAAVGKGE